MPANKDLTIAYHQQDTGYYCGAACAQMVLDSIGAGLLDQDGLYNDNHSHSTTESGWASGPDGLTWTMNNRKPPTFGNYFVLYNPTTEDSISRKIVWTIHHYQVAPIALVFGWAHWIVVRGYTASDTPESSADTSYSISGFDINNPWPPSPSASDPALAPPPPHGGADNCGTGGDRGIADEHISYTAWHDTYMTGVPGGHWAGQFLAVCDPEPPPKRTGTPGYTGERLPGERIIPAQQASELARRSLDEFGLMERENYKRAFDRGRLADPMLVHRLDHLDSFYYIVPSRENGSVNAAVIVDARTGQYLQSTVRRGDTGTVVPLFEPKSVRERVVGRAFELADRRGRILVRKEALCQYPTLVWKPCRESLSPYYPFHMFTVGAHQIFVRIDGAVFTRLHDTDRGI
jgi:hypothetical protein